MWIRPDLPGILVLSGGLQSDYGGCTDVPRFIHLSRRPDVRRQSDVSGHDNMCRHQYMPQHTHLPRAGDVHGICDV